MSKYYDQFCKFAYLYCGLKGTDEAISTLKLHVKYNVELLCE